MSFWKRVAWWWVCFFVGHDVVWSPAGDFGGCVRCWQKIDPSR